MSGLEILGAVASSIALIRQQCDGLKKEIVTIDGFILEAMRQTGLPLCPQPPPGTTQEHPMVSLAVQELQGILEALNQIVFKYTNDRKWHDPRRIARKMQWLSEGKKIEELGRKARETKHDLHLAITLRTSSSVSRIGTQQEVSVAWTPVRFDFKADNGLGFYTQSSSARSIIWKAINKAKRDYSMALSLAQLRLRIVNSTNQVWLWIGKPPVLRHHISEGLVLFPDDTTEFGTDLIEKAIVDQAYESIEILLEMWKNVLPQQGLPKLRVGYAVNFTLVHHSRSVADDKTRHVLAKVLSFAQGYRRIRRTHQAARQGDTVQMRQALREQPEAINELDSCGNAPIHYAAMYDNIDVLEQLILAGADTIRRDFEGWTPLMIATENGHEEAAQILLQNDQCCRHVDLQRNDGRTALHCAVRAESPECVHMLLEAGASAEKRDFIGHTPLHLLAPSQADQQTAHRIIRLLQGQHARLDAQDNFGVTALLQAVKQNNAPVLRALVDAGASLNTTTTSSENILHLAAYTAYLETINYLAERHLTLVDPRLRDVRGLTPLGRLGWCWQAEEWQLTGNLRRPSPEEQQTFVSLYFGLLSHYLLRHMSTLKQLLRAAEQRDTSTASERIAALIQKSDDSGRGHMVSWYRGILGNVRDENWDQVVLDVQDEYDEVYEELGRAGVARNKTLADPEVRAFA
ncbi:Hypothetical protein NCS54_01181800 [Fusarium falciforme]|uniref:Hypothetical protein n=1 Tax=Fusarium falciforme TaxID=195108 RepID=UPI0022FFF43E|nr:Hypothetical protein NCS54_01181800 [Fusarium falciforme]WAO94244.1 Hypothetical protein NCS54_01181800 [Fusarium falciforme]